MYVLNICNFLFFSYINENTKKENSSNSRFKTDLKGNTGINYPELHQDCRIVHMSYQLKRVKKIVRTWKKKKSGKL